jgi:hypothetical protein
MNRNSDLYGHTGCEGLARAGGKSKRFGESQGVKVRGLARGRGQK